MKKNKVMISKRNGERFEIEYKPFSKRVIITCTEVKGLNFHGAINELVKDLNLETDEDGIMDISYRCKSRQVFEKILSTLKRP